MVENLFLPDIPTSQMFIDDEKVMTIEWQEFFRLLFNRVGGTTAPTSDELDLSMVSELYSTPESYIARINDLEKKIESLLAPKFYDKRINDLERKLEAIPSSIQVDKEFFDFLNVKEPFKFYLPQITYEDLQVSISNIRVPAANAPTERLNDHGIAAGVTFPSLGFSVDDYIYFDVQTQHSMKLSSILDHHIHYMTPTDGTGDSFKFQLDVIVAPIGGNWIAPAGTPFTREVLMAADLSNSHMLEDLADIPGENTTVSSIYKFVLTRIDVVAPANEYAGEVYLEFTDCHFQKDSSGSRNETSK